MDETKATKLAILTLSASRSAGGMFESVSHLAKGFASDRRYDVRVLSFRDKFSALDSEQWLPAQTILIEPLFSSKLGYSRRLSSLLKEFAPHLISCHNLWTLLSSIALRYSQVLNTPYMVTLHGMLTSEALRRGAFRKRVSGILFQREHLARSSCIRVFSTGEAAAARAFGLSNPIVVVPNGVQLPDSGDGTIPKWRTNIPKKYILLFLGRIHPLKGVFHLLEAWKQAKLSSPAAANDWALVLAGWDELGITTELLGRANLLGISRDVAFIGPVFAKEKDATYRSATAFVLPSRSEALSMASLEALAHGLPLLHTKACNLPEAARSSAAIETDITSVDLSRGIVQLFGMSEQERKEMGARGRALVEKHFTWESAIGKMDYVFNWILNGGSPPDFQFP